VVLRHKNPLRTEGHHAVVEDDLFCNTRTQGKKRSLDNINADFLCYLIKINPNFLIVTLNRYPTSAACIAQIWNAAKPSRR